MDVINLANGLKWVLLLLVSLSVHEWAHAFAADKLGDPTPRSEGRVTLNPLAHIDLFGTIIFPFLCIMLSTGIIFGWGKPVNVNSANFKRIKLYEMLVGVSGVLGNMLICLVCAIIAAFLSKTNASLCYSMIYINCFLIVFNMIPMPPLDGSYVTRYFFKISDETMSFLNRWGFFIIIILLNIDAFRQILHFAINALASIFFKLTTIIAF